MSHHIKKAFIAFLKVTCYLVCVSSFNSMNSSSLSRKKYRKDDFTPTTRKRLRGQNTSVRIGLIKLTESSNTMSYKPFFNKLFHMYFYYLYSCGTKSFVIKTELHFTFFKIWFGLAVGVAVLKVLCFWCSIYQELGK